MLSYHCYTACFALALGHLPPVSGLVHCLHETVRLHLVTTASFALCCLCISSVHLFCSVSLCHCASFCPLCFLLSAYCLLPTVYFRQQYTTPLYLSAWERKNRLRKRRRHRRRHCNSQSSTWNYLRHSATSTFSYSKTSGMYSNTSTQPTRQS